MSNPRLRLKIILSGAALIIGGGIGYKIHHDRQAVLSGAPVDSQAVLHVLAIKGVLTPEIVKGYESENGVRVMLTEADTPEALWDKLEAPPAAHPYDVVSLFSYQVPLAVQGVRLQPIQAAKLRRFAAVGNDFRDLPGDSSHSRLVPVLWGVSGLAYDSKKVDPPPSSWRALVGQSKGHGKIGLLSSTADLARWLPVEDHDEEDHAHGSGHGDDSGEETESSAPDASDIDVKRALAQTIASSVLSPSFWKSGELVGRGDVSVVQMNHGETAFLPKEAADWKFVLPEEKGGFWVLSFALTREMKMEPQAHAFLDYLLDGETAVKLTQASHQASTNSNVEKAEIDSRLKPSYLRQLPLTRIYVLRDFQSARAVRAVITPLLSETKAPKRN